MSNWSVLKYIKNKVDNENDLIITTNKIGCFFKKNVIIFARRIRLIIIPIKKGINDVKLLKGLDNISKIKSYFFRTINIAVPLIPGIIVDRVSIIPRKIYVKKLFSKLILTDNLLINIVIVNNNVNIIIFGIFLFLNSSNLNSKDPTIKPIKSNKIGK